MAARLPAARRRLVAHQHRSHGQPHLGSVGRELVEIPFGHLDSRCPGHSPFADLRLRPQFFSADAEPLHPTPEPVCRSICSRTSPISSSLRQPAGALTVTCCVKRLCTRCPTMAAIVGWDNPSSYAIRGAPMDYATCWSQLQKDELVLRLRLESRTCAHWRHSII